MEDIHSDGIIKPAVGGEDSFTAAAVAAGPEKESIMKFAYTVIFVEDVTLTVAFYEQAFGLKHKVNTKFFAQMDTGDTSLAFGWVGNEQKELGALGFYKNQPDADPAGAQVSFVTADVQSSFERATAAGAVAVVAPRLMPWGQTISRVRDINGFLVSIVTAPKF
jgi:lactoylglutathione lyase